MASRGPARRAEDQPSKEQRHGRADDQEFGMDLRDYPGNERGADHPSHDARDAEQQDNGEDQLERTVAGQLGQRYTFCFLGWA